MPNHKGQGNIQKMNRPHQHHPSHRIQQRRESPPPPTHEHTSGGHPANSPLALSRKPTPEERESELLYGNCHICEWKGYITYPTNEFAGVRHCDCQEEICPVCDGEGGFEVKLPSGNRAWKVCGCQTLERKMELYRNAKIPSRFADKTLDAFAPNHKTQAQARAHLYQLYRNPATHRAFKPGDKGVVLMGPPGVGKTHLMVGFLRHVLLERGIPCRFQDFGVLLAELRSSYTNGLSEMEILRGLINVDVLLIDDLGKGRNSKWESGIIDTLISCRYNTKRTTLITTNYTQELETTLRERYRGRGSTEGEELLMRDTLADRVGERVYSRLREMCDFFFISGVDYRQR
ncbi:MAG: DNA replication protein [Deltaproteobacteria bacterium]|nr:DNA replication protein [Deltaproteobacteria bacterium]MBU51393.1 DNA replication protein [Deltaproteobacteria bacterium]|tara:strand:- start:6568 stop:7605 length:1038 start_codon:yes stop_codon:yes gene_type:complete